VCCGTFSTPAPLRPICNVYPLTELTLKYYQNEATASIDIHETDPAFKFAMWRKESKCIIQRRPTTQAGPVLRRKTRLFRIQKRDLRFTPVVTKFFSTLISDLTVNKNPADFYDVDPNSRQRARRDFRKSAFFVL